MSRHCAVGLIAGLLLAAALPAQAIVLRYRPKINKLTPSTRSRWTGTFRLPSKASARSQREK